MGSPSTHALTGSTLTQLTHCVQALAFGVGGHVTELNPGRGFNTERGAAMNYPNLRPRNGEPHDTLSATLLGLALMVLTTTWWWYAMR